MCVFVWIYGWGPNALEKKRDRNNDCCSEMNVCWELNASEK